MKCHKEWKKLLSMEACNWVCTSGNLLEKDNWSGWDQGERWVMSLCTGGWVGIRVHPFKCDGESTWKQKRPWGSFLFSTVSHSTWINWFFILENPSLSRKWSILSQVVQVSTASFAGDMIVFFTWKPKEMIKVATAPGELVAESAILDLEVWRFPCLGACIIRRTSRHLDTEGSDIKWNVLEKYFFLDGWNSTFLG